MCEPADLWHDTAALFRRADEALWESRRLLAAISGQREQARNLMCHLRRSGASLDAPTRILYPRDTVDMRMPSKGA